MDAVVGGGGLIQMPAALILLPQYPVATVTGTIKIPAYTGTFLQSLEKLSVLLPLQRVVCIDMGGRAGRMLSRWL